jgi:hypothetical protein
VGLVVVAIFQFLDKPVKAGQDDDAERRAELFLIPPFPFSATNRAHGRILAKRAKVPQLMVTLIFKARNPCKHWSKRVPGAFLSSMFY